MLAFLRWLWNWRKRRALRQFIKFCTVGAINTVVDFGLYYAMTRFTAYFAVHYVQANTLSFGTAVLSSFLLNTFWTFRAGGAGWHRRAPKFLAVALVGLAISDVIVHLVVQAGGHDMLGKVLATGLVTTWNFLAQKYWTFRIKS